jgi:hypothetical protein
MSIITSAALGATLSGIAKASAAAAQAGVPNPDAYWTAVADAILTAIQNSLIITIPVLTSSGITAGWTGPGTATVFTPGPTVVTGLTGGVLIP